MAIAALQSQVSALQEATRIAGLELRTIQVQMETLESGHGKLMSIVIVGNGAEALTEQGRRIAREVHEVREEARAFRATVRADIENRRADAMKLRVAVVAGLFGLAGAVISLFR